jgi:propanediol utilization protein
MDLERIARAVLARGFVEVEASGRHVHLTAAQAVALFGHDLTPERGLSQPGQFLARERVTLIGPKGRLEKVAVLGPARKAAQVEISLTDGKLLGITPPVRLSGQVEGTPGAVLVGEKGRITLETGVICAQRHIHMTPEDGARLGIGDGQRVKLKIFSGRPVVFEEVPVRISEDFRTRAHLDFDEANACGFRAGDLGRIVP